MVDDYYELLNIADDASQEEIKKAYQILVLKCHPDKANSSNDTGLEMNDLFLKVQHAKETLFDVEKRKSYNRKLKEQNLKQVKGPLFSSETLETMDYDKDNQCFYFDCRCGGCYVLDLPDVDKSKQDTLYIQCDDCTFYIEVKLKDSDNND